MSRQVETPVAKYGKSSDFGKVLDFIQSMISNETLRQAFDIPHLVVVGRQNMAKTTLINRLIGRYLLPMRRDETANTLQARTTCPIILNLRNGLETAVEVKCDAYPDIGGRVEKPTDDVVEKFLTEFSTYLLKEEGTLISKTPVKVTLQGPDLTTLTLVDLPGVHFANNDPRMNHATQSLVLDYIEKNTKSIIVIVSEVGDLTGDNAINLVIEKAADFRSRTICVLTKPDRLRHSDDMGLKVALNQSSFTLEENRFILLRGKDATDTNEKDWDAKTTRLKEREWFEGHPQYKSILHLCGIDRLMDTMISLLAEKMGSEIPILVNQMEERKKKVDSELQKLSESEVPESSNEKRRLEMKVKHNLVTQLRDLLHKNRSKIRGGEQVRALFNEFHNDVYKVDPLVLQDDDEIRRRQRGLAGVFAPLGDSSEDSQLLEELLYESYTYEKKTQGNKEAVQIIEVKSPVDQLIPITENLVKNVEKTLREIVQGAINENFSKFPTALKVVETNVVNKIFKTKRKQTTEFIQHFIEMQKKSIDRVFAPVPFPDELKIWDSTLLQNRKPHPCMESPMMFHLKCLAAKLYPEGMIKAIERGNNQGNSKDLEDMKKTKKNVVRYFNEIKMNVCDTVPRCILHFFITQFVDDFEHALEQEDLVEFLKEKQEIRNRRIQFRAESAALEEALPRTDDVVQMLLRIQDGSGESEMPQF
ncbi:interferon-induced GTP-binding protein Mx1-like [Porites lutea]|uniref:interferon-induced GTP-binding protein Mx1-like n=1 Tax=Porites lutea TaxID=51062 RepID=UPI003CC6505A